MMASGLGADVKTLFFLGSFLISMATQEKRRDLYDKFCDNATAFLEHKKNPLRWGLKLEGRKLKLTGGGQVVVGVATIGTVPAFGIAVAVGAAIAAAVKWRREDDEEEEGANAE